MDEITPPKRVTRARAAAKGSHDSQVEAKSAPAAKSTRTKAAATVATTKRKTRADESVEQNQLSNEEMDQAPVRPKTTRGRAKKTVRELAAEAEAEMEGDELAAVMVVPLKLKTTRGRATVVEKEMAIPPAAAPKTRGRPKKVVEEMPGLAVEGAKTTRGRAKRTEVVDDEETNSIEVLPQPVKKTTRGRAAASAPSKVGTAPKKTVKFEEPHEVDKENVIPVTKVKSKAKEVVIESGLKAKPVRQLTATAATRATRGRSKIPDKEKSPLSPKKATQIAKGERDSEDELATMEKTSPLPMMKSPLKPTGPLFRSANKHGFTASIVANRAMVPDTQSLGTSLMGSPARRPPQSPFKDAIKESPKRTTIMGDSILKSPFKLSMGPPKTSGSPFKTSLLQSPARRPQSPTKASVRGSPSRSSSMLNATPKPTPFSVSRFGATPRTLTKSAYPPGKPLFGSAVKTGSSDEQVQPIPKSQIKPFSGRLSSVMPRHADLDLEQTSIPAGIPEARDTEQVDPTAVLPEVSSFQPLVVHEAHMVIDEAEIPVVEETVGNAESTTPTHSPPRHSIGSFNSLRDENPFEDSESEDELASADPKYSSAMLSSFKISSKDFAATSTPTRHVPIPKAPNNEDGVAPKSAGAKLDQIGFMPLAQQLSSWMGASPESDKSSTEDENLGSPTKMVFQQSVRADLTTVVAASPAKTTFFEDEMVVHDDLPSKQVEPVENIDEEADILDEVGFEPTVMDEVDIALAAEAEEMSVLDENDIENGDEDDIDMLVVPAAHLGDDVLTDEEPAMKLQNNIVIETTAGTEEDLIDDLVVIPDHGILSDDILVNEDSEDAEAVQIPNASMSTGAVSEASQEYGDENAIPIDPELMALERQDAEKSYNSPVPKLATPIRYDQRDFEVHTVSKVPLKAAVEDTPSRLTFDFNKKRPASASRVVAQRHAPPPPVPATSVTSRTLQFNPDITPVKSSGWSTTVTPIRTPRADVSSQVLKGAVVYVDVHTTEGADASAVFVELLGQMGARCVKSWGWNPRSVSASPESIDASSTDKESKIGITHVVFKDGGKRTLEKVRESKGVVCCVGVGWVLDCERTQTWVGEAAYNIDTSLVPRGGNRRRKSMEPRQLFRQNGNVTPRTTCPVAIPQTMPVAYLTSNNPSTPATVGFAKMDRRKSTIWERSPSSDGGNGDAGEEALVLSPVPMTPAPETISMYSEHVLDGDSGEPTPYFLRQQDLVMKTAPAHRVAKREDVEILGERREYGDGDSGGGVLMQRLLLARRKSLQFAPKVASPLARGASYQE